MISNPENTMPGKLLAIGGGMELNTSNPILTKFIELCGGRSARIIILPTASDYGIDIGVLYKEIFSELCDNVEYFLIDKRRDALDEKCLVALEQATGVFFTGGDQLRITSLLGGSKFMRILRSKLQQGTNIAGTSAGASAMSSTMIAWGRSDEMFKGSLQISPGLGLIHQIVIDSHFVKRGRISRLLHLVAQHPGVLGIGLAEDTGILLDSDETSSTFEVIGKRQIVVVDGKNIAHSNIAHLPENSPYTVTGVGIDVLGPGYSYNYVTHEIIYPSEVNSSKLVDLNDEVSEFPYKTRVPTHDY
ncbi:MAG: cyanophycinase [Candidatus Heimdallarchaeota archaeon]|nr:cyanophycinase [Candidatus Heimdallarchaeota archaeon]